MRPTPSRSSRPPARRPGLTVVAALAALAFSPGAVSGTALQQVSGSEASAAAAPAAAPADSGTASVAGPRPAAAGAALDVLRDELERLAGTSGGVMGLGIHHLETGREVYVRGDEAFPMASTYKVPIAVQLLTRVERGEVSLDSLVELRPRHLHPGSGTLTPLFDDPGVHISLRNLFELMLQISDNSGTDLVLEAAGGPEDVTARMRRAGLDDIRVDRPTLLLIADYLGIEDLPPEEEMTPERFEALADSIPEEDREAARDAFPKDPRDTATPRDMTRLLADLWNRELLGAGSSDLLLDVMRRCLTGEGRLKGMLPPETVVAHKTGTVGGTTNDVGVIELPDGRGHVVVAAFVRESELDVEERERAIAQAARAVYDYFLFTTGDVAERSLPELTAR